MPLSTLAQWIPSRPDPLPAATSPAADSEARAAFRRLAERLAGISRGQRETVEKLLCCFLSGGHALLEDLPGSGKTTLAKALCAGFGGAFRRAQFTPDLMPADLLGSSLFNPQTRAFELHKGPVFCNVLLADEINRASPRAQSALLEAMAEGQVSIDGETLALPTPFFVVATQNPAETHGAYPLPEAQLDRFCMRLSLARLTLEEETELVVAKSRGFADLMEIEPMGLDLARAAREEAMATTLSQELADYIVRVARATRELPDARLGVSSRGAIALARAAQARAWLRGRPAALPGDALALAHDCWAHRLGWADSGSPAARERERQAIDRSLAQVAVPV
jgi:MoxR-like ATPase